MAYVALLVQLCVAGEPQCSPSLASCFIDFDVGFGNAYNAMVEGEDLNMAQRSKLCSAHNWVQKDACHSSCPLQLEILDPPELRTSMCISDNIFTPYDPSAHIDNFHPLNNQRVEIVAAGLPGQDTRKGCEPTDYNGKDFTGKLALIKRGICYFYQKFESAKQGGAIAGIMVNHLTENSVEGQMVSMSGPSSNLADFPAMFAPRHIGDVLFEALDKGVQVFGRLRLTCNSSQPQEAVTDGCPAASLIADKTCDMQVKDVNRLCVRCPLEAHFGGERLCLWGSTMYPRKTALFLQKVVPMPITVSSEVVYAVFQQDGCVEADYAGLQGKIVFFTEPASCLPFQAVRVASRAGVRAVVMMTTSSASEIMFPEGSSDFVNIPVHSVGPAEAKRFLDVVVRTARPFTGAGLLQGAVFDTVTFKEGVMPVQGNRTSLGNVFRSVTVEQVEETSSSLTINAGVIICLVLILVLTGAIGVKFVHRWRTAQPMTTLVAAGGAADNVVTKKFSIPLSVASISLSLSLLLSMATVAFVLAYTAGKEATDAATENGNKAADATYLNAADNVLDLAKQLRISTINRVAQGINSLISDGELVAANIASLYLDTNGEWNKFHSHFDSFVEQSLSSRWTYTMLSTEGFYAGGGENSVTNDHSNPGLATNNNGSHYGLIVHFYSGQRRISEEWYGTEQVTWDPMKQLGAGRGDPLGLVNGKPRGFMQWHLTLETYFEEITDYTMPVSVFTPVYNRSNSYVGVAEARITLTTIKLILAAAASTNQTIVVYDLKTNSILGTNVYAEHHYPYQLLTVSMDTQRGAYTLSNIPNIELLSLGSFLKQKEVVPGKDTSGSFDQKEHYPDVSFSVGCLRASTTSDAVVDECDTQYDAEMRGSCGVDGQDCFTANNGRKAFRFDGTNVLHIYRNLTTDIARVKATRTSAPGAPWESNHYQYKTAMLIPGTSKECASFNFQLDSTPSYTCMQREAFLHSSFSIHVRFTSDEALSSSTTTQQLFSSSRAGDSVARLNANGMFLLGSLSSGCRVNALPNGVSANEPHTLTAVVDYERGVCAVYYDGRLHASSTMSDTYEPSSEEAYLAGRFFNGLIEDVHMFNISMERQEAANLHETGQFKRYVPVKDWYADVSTVSRHTDLSAGVSWGIGVLIPRQTIMGMVDANNQVTRKNLATQEKNTENRLRQIISESVLVLVCLGLLSILLFIVFNELLTKPFASVASAMSDAAVMRVQAIPEKHSVIAELDLMYTAMKQMLENLESYRPFLPDALFENMQWVPQAPERENGLPPGMRTGVVAIVFTDVQASTQLWESCPGMKLALKTHNKVIRDSIDLFGGYEVKTIGDAYMVAFDSAHKACDFSLHVQEMLFESEWTQDVLEHPLCRTDEVAKLRGLRIRIGINFGDADVEFNPVTGRYDYFGSTVNKASRVESVGIAGAVTVSKEVLDEVLDAKSLTNIETVSVETAGGDFSGLSVPCSLYNIGKVDLKGVASQSFLAVLVPVKLALRAVYVKQEISRRKRGSLSNAVPVGKERDLDRRSSGASSVSRNSGGRMRKHRMNKYELKNEATLARIGVAIETATESQEAMATANDGLGKVLSCLDRSEGTVVSVLSCSVQASWNTARPCANHLEGGFRFLRLLRSSIVDKPEFYRTFSIGVATGSVLYGNVGNTMQKFITCVGAAVDLSGHLSSSAALLGVYCLHGAVPRQGSTAFSDENLKRNCRPVDIWDVKNRPGESVVVYEVRTDTGSDRWGQEDELTQVTHQANWGWTDEYIDAFEKKDHFKIATYSKEDEVLQTVAEMLKSQTGLRAAVRL